MRKCLSLVPQARGFKIASLNIASLPAHIDELRLLMADKNLDVLAINETRLSDSIDDSCIHIQGYDIVRRDRNRNGGGVCLCSLFNKVQNTIKPHERHLRGNCC